MASTRVASSAVEDAERGAEWLRSRWEHLEPLPPEVQASALALLYELHDARQQARAEHARTISRLAEALGYEVGAGRRTLVDAERRLDQVVRTTWSDMVVPCHRVPLDEGTALAGEAFDRGLRAGRFELDRRNAAS